MQSTPEYNKEFVEAHIKHIFEVSWEQFKDAEVTNMKEKIIHGTVVETMRLLAENMELDINFAEIELDIDLKKLQDELNS